MIEIRGLSKIFRHKNSAGALVDKIAVDGLSFAIERGEIFGLLGKNGAGKTTTIRMLTLQTRPTRGEIFFDGFSSNGRELEIKKMIGVVPQHINFDQDLTVGENMELHARLHHINRAERRRRIDELLNYVELSDVRNDGVKSLSGGMKRRLLIIRAMIHRPQILFLDEPTVALDPQVRRRIWALIRRLKSEGVTIVLTTHYIEEASDGVFVEGTADRARHSDQPPRGAFGGDARGSIYPIDGGETLIDVKLLDEPTIALDPQVRRRIWALIRRLKSEGVTIVLTTHYIEEAEALCDRTRTAFLSKGRLIALDTPTNLRAEHSAATLEEVFIRLTEARA